MEDSVRVNRVRVNRVRVNRVKLGLGLPVPAESERGEVGGGEHHLLFGWVIRLPGPRCPAALDCVFRHWFSA